MRTLTETSVNCLSWWYPRIAGHVPTPETYFVRVSDWMELAKILDNQECWYFNELCVLLGKAVDRVGTPCFLRTGQGSGKHDWKNCCFLESRDDLPQHICKLVEWSHLVDFIGLRHDVWVVRKMLDVEPLFRCTAYGDMPVVREWRYFVKGGQVLYGIPYWPEGALEQGRPDREDWHTFVPLLHAEPIEQAAKLAATVSEVVEGAWSVDMLCCKDGGWYVTDMALAHMSHGWEAGRIDGPTP